MTATWNLADLPAIPIERRTDPALTERGLLYEIELAIRQHPRTQQTTIGPSEIGTPCARRLAYRFAGVPEVNPRGAAWKPTVGTAVHEWLGCAFINHNVRIDALRYLVEVPVYVGMVNGKPVHGTADLYDRVTCTVVDFKVMGVSSLRAARAGFNAQYRTQVQLYARGFQLAGLPVDTVAILGLPQNGELSEHVWHAEPYNEQVAVDALERVSGIARVVEQYGAAVATVADTADHYCMFCPWHMPASTTLTEACPGHVEKALP